MIETLYAALRIIVIVASGAAGAIALTHVLVRRGTLQPFGALPRFVRRTSDPVLKPIEHKLLRAGGNPQDASYWLLGGTFIGGLAGLALFCWLLQTIADAAYAGQAGPGAMLRQVVSWGFGLCTAALLVRVIGSWFGVSPYARWMRPVRWLTDWILIPIQRVLPTMGPFDLSPIVAYFALMLLRSLVLGLIG
jgi:YggT family protein